MRLADLNPRFLKDIDERNSKFVHDIADADGIMFLCPKCFTENGGAAGTHSVICWRPHVAQSRFPIPGRWEFEGSGFADLSLVAGSSSVLLTGGCAAHFFVRVGQIEMC